MRKRVWVFWILAVLLALPQLVNAGSPVWLVSKSGKELFLGGTVHLLSKDDYPLPQSFAEAYKRSDTVVFETDLDEFESDEMRNKMISMVTYTDGQSLQGNIKKETYDKLSKHLQQRNIAIENLLHLKPGMIAITLSIIEMQMMGLDGVGVDSYYNRIAKNGEKKRVYLESAEEQLHFIAGIGVGREDEIILHALKEIKQLPVLLGAMKKAWRGGDNRRLKELGLTPMKNDFPKIYHDLIVKRNRAWIDKMGAMLMNSDVELILVGALHLVGEDGLLSLLERDGYSVTPLP